jgi:hypothetical protein
LSREYIYTKSQDPKNIMRQDNARDMSANVVFVTNNFYLAGEVGEAGELSLAQV